MAHYVVNNETGRVVIKGQGSVDQCFPKMIEELADLHGYSVYHSFFDIQVGKKFPQKEIDREKGPKA